MKGAPLAARVREEVASEVAEIGSVGLATVLVGDDPASHVYVGKKHEAAVEAGICSVDHRLAGDTTQETLLAVLDELNADDGVDGILVQLPVPDGIDEEAVLRAVEPMKDVDGFHPFNAGRLYAGHPTFVPATPLGIMAILEEHGIALEGANATVTICHSRTRDLGAVTTEADVLVVGIGRAKLVTAEMVKPGAAVVDVGITRTDEGLVGDVDPGAAEVAGHLTPVPGGVGPMTIAMLLANTVRAARYRRGLLAFP